MQTTSTRTIVVVRTDRGYTGLTKNASLRGLVPKGTEFSAQLKPRSVG
jgi:hypothetical protein